MICNVLFFQATHITFICPMRFDKFPLDTQQCKFQVGSYSYDDTKMTFTTQHAGYQAPKQVNSIALDYAINIKPLREEDQVFLGGALGKLSYQIQTLELLGYLLDSMNSGLPYLCSTIQFINPSLNALRVARLGMFSPILTILVNFECACRFFIKKMPRLFLAKIGEYWKILANFGDYVRLLTYKK